MSRDQRGQAAVLLAFGSVLTFAAMGFSIDLGHFYYRKQVAQAAADAAAMAGISYAVSNGTGAELVVTGKVCGNSAITSGTAPYVACQYAEATANGGYPAGDITITSANSVPAKGPTSSTYWVRVTVSESLNTTFLRFVSGNPGAATVSAQTTAAMVSNGVSADPPCMYILGSTGTTFTIGNGAAATASGCGVYVNSASNTSSTPAASITGGARLNSPVMKVAASGTYAYVDNNGGELCTAPGSSCTAMTPQTGATAVADPFANVTAPSSPGGCTTGNWSTSGTTTVNPGCYNGFSMSNNASLVLTSGVYYIVGGEFSIQGGGTLTATSGVTIYLTGTGTNYANYAYVNIANGVTVDMTAQSSGPYEGILFFQDRCPSCTAGTTPTASNFAGGSSTTLTGSLYMKNSEVIFNNGSTESSTMALVVNSVDFEGGTTVFNEATSQSQTGLAVPGNKSVIVQ